MNPSDRMNGDEIVDAKDRIFLTHYLADKDTYADRVKLSNADVNANAVFHLMTELFLPDMMQDRGDMIPCPIKISR